jgi:spoIIIJ-associated protein
MADEVTRESQAVAAREFMEGLLEAYGFDASVETQLLDEDIIEVATDGSELGLLVGPRGATLAALQDVTRTVVQHRFPTRTDRILVDVAGYRQRRVAALQRFTQQIAEEVLESRTERVLEPMSPADRKVVHDTVTEIEGLSTRSEGEDAARHVVITPTD